MVVEESREGFEVSGLESEGPEIEITAEVGEDVDDEERIEDDEPMEIGYRLDPEECGQVFTEFREAARAVKNLEVEYRETAPPVPPMENPSEYVAYMPEDASKRATEYEIDIEDIIFVKKINAVREEAKLDPMSYGKFELLMDRFEKSSYFKKLGVRKEEDPDAVCCVCMDGETDDQNQIIFCDLCNIPVHQDCYGVPYVPAGEWFCRRCTLSPSIRVKCIMCGQRGGAMKQTSDSQWVHVICAIWINETCFGNPVFMEPVQNADKAIELRKNLKCVVCRERMGACIQCSFGTCARAFHVFCGVRANFEMTTQEIDNNSDVVIRKALCPEHCSDQDVREKTKKMLLRKKGLNFDLKLEEDEVCSISEADILPERIQDISRDLDVPWIEHFVGYWRFKREQKLGMPLLRSLQKAMKKMMGHKVEDLESEEEEKESEDSAIEEDMESKPEIEETEETQMMEVKKEEMMEDEIMKDLIKIRREKIKEESEEEETEEETDEEPPNLEQEGELPDDQAIRRLKNLLEMVQKRELQKRELTALKLHIFMAKCNPLRDILQTGIDALIEKDDMEVFTQPVSENDVPGYRSVIKKPMDISRIQSKLDDGVYLNAGEFIADYKRMISNCKFFNKHNDFYLKYATDYEVECRPIIEKIITESRTSASYDVLQEMNPYPSGFATEKSTPCRRDTPKRNRKRKLMPDEEPPSSTSPILLKSPISLKSPSCIRSPPVRIPKLNDGEQKAAAASIIHDANHPAGLVQSSLYKFFSRDLQPSTSKENDENGKPQSPATSSRRRRRPSGRT